MSATSIATATDALASASTVPVALVHWPAEHDRNASLSQLGHLRLLLVDASAPPPPDWDPFMDWIRLPADELDIGQRVVDLRRRLRLQPPPRLDEHGLVWRGTSWVGLAPIEARFFALLLERPGCVCGRERLERRAWPEGAPSTHSLSAYIRRVRRRVEPLGLAIRTVRRRGYFVEIDPSPTTWERSVR